MLQTPYYTQYSTRQQRKCLYARIDLSVCIQSLEKQGSRASQPYIMWQYVLPTEWQRELNQNIIVLLLGKTPGICIVLILLIHKVCWGLSQQSLGSSVSQNTVTSGIFQREIMLCDPVGNGWWRSQHWDVYRLCYFTAFSPLSHLAWLVRFTLCLLSIFTKLSVCR